MSKGLITRRSDKKRPLKSKVEKKAPKEPKQKKTGDLPLKVIPMHKLVISHRGVINDTN